MRAFFNLTAVSFLVLFSTQAYGTDSRNPFEESEASIVMAMLLNENAQANSSVHDGQETYAETFNDSENPTFDSLLKNLELIESGKFSIRNFEILREELKDVRKQLRQNPNDIKAHVKLGIIYRKLGQDQEAIASYKEAIRIEPDYFYAHLNLGATYHGLGRYQEAIASYKEVTRIKPDAADAHVNLGIAYSKLGQGQDAIASFKEAIQIKPNDASTGIDLGVAYENLGQNQETGAHDNLGIAYSKLGQQRDAIASFKKAIQIKPDAADAHNNLGYTYEKLDQYQDAIALSRKR